MPALDVVLVGIAVVSFVVLVVLVARLWQKGGAWFWSDFSHITKVVLISALVFVVFGFGLVVLVTNLVAEGLQGQPEAISTNVRIYGATAGTLVLFYLVLMFAMRKLLRTFERERDELEMIGRDLEIKAARRTNQLELVKRELEKQKGALEKVLRETSDKGGLGRESKAEVEAEGRNEPGGGVNEPNEYEASEKIKSDQERLLEEALSRKAESGTVPAGESVGSGSKRQKSEPALKKPTKAASKKAKLKAKLKTKK